MPETLFPQPHVAVPDFFNLYAREKFGVPDGWRWVRLDCSADGAPAGFAAVEGAVCPAKIDGSPDWQRRTKDSERTLWFNLNEFDAWKLALANKHGVCLKCWGSGQELVSFGVDGSKYQTCYDCKGSGRPSPAESEVRA